MKIGYCALAAVGILLTSCSKKPSAPGGGKSGRGAGGGPIPVFVAKAASRDVPVEIKAVGNVQAYSFVSVRPQITGKIIKVHFSEGQEVKSGDLLFTIDPRPFESALNQSAA